MDSNSDITTSMEEEMVFNTEKDKKAQNKMWLDGIVTNASAGYGSKLDGYMYVISICDSCMTSKQKDGTVALIGDYMSGIDIDILEESKRIWRRYNGLEDLLE